MSNPTLTVRQLRAALDKLDRSWDDKNVSIWLPGSHIDLSPNGGKVFLNIKGECCIEGNLREGSALS